MYLMSLLVAAALVVGGQAPAADSPAAAEQERIRALLEADYDSLQRLLGDDLTYTHSTGKVDTRTSYLEPLLSGRTRYRTLDASDVAVRHYGGSAVITGVMKSVATVAGAESRTTFRFTAMWVLREGRWTLVAWQSTRVP